MDTSEEEPERCQAAADVSGVLTGLGRLSVGSGPPPSPFSLGSRFLPYPYVLLAQVSPCPRFSALSATPPPFPQSLPWLHPPKQTAPS